MEDLEFPISVGSTTVAVAVSSAPPIALVIEGSDVTIELNETPAIEVTLASPETVVEIEEIRPAAALVYSGTMSQLFLAAETIGGHRAVSLDENGRIIAADAPGNDFAIGLIRDSVTAGGTAEVHLLGKVGGFSGLIPGAIYFVGAAGVLTPDPPLSGVSQMIGRSYSKTEMIVQPSDPTLL
jgi:hypothetical protein